MRGEESKMRAEESKTRAEESKMRAEESKMRAKESKMRAEESKMRAEESKMKQGKDVGRGAAKGTHKSRPRLPDIVMAMQEMIAAAAAQLGQVFQLPIAMLVTAAVYICHAPAEMLAAAWSPFCIFLAIVVSVAGWTKISSKITHVFYDKENKADADTCAQTLTWTFLLGQLVVYIWIGITENEAMRAYSMSMTWWARMGLSFAVVLTGTSIAVPAAMLLCAAVVGSVMLCIWLVKSIMALCEGCPWCGCHEECSALETARAMMEGRKGETEAQLGEKMVK
ncbi:hypothetical protein LTR36_002767 [Oleoguttula mirabilis]|uniref:Uncharacterized protein n=1 Tax=Oleoguttula mirabilis TaxID=1507867 RepID=A0AAV9JJ09_9PEZI|nr:hypothetical protein LTR36_002767 [Oleoguttula mirabilis]